MPTGFNTYQTVKAYEEALARHGQYVRWTRTITCPCIQKHTRQPNPQCTMCKGRGRLYRTPGNMQVWQEAAKHNSYGKITPLHIPVVSNSIVAWRGGAALSLGSQPGDGSYIQLAAPYPKAWEAVEVDYNFTPILSIEDEDSTVIGVNTLRTIATLFIENGKPFEGSIKAVSKVYNVTRDENYIVVEAVKEYIYLQSMGTWQSGDTLQVSYTYVKPFNFILAGISQKIRYEKPYILEDAEASLITPYWARVSPNDLITSLVTEQISDAVVNPNVGSGNDEIRNYYDVSKLMFILDSNGDEYTIGADVELYGRNEIKWNVTKPTTPYTVQFLYHPTWIALTSFATVRNAENKQFVNRIGLKQFDHVTDKVRY